jgi:small conductance mechanosensitive channel
VDVPVGVEYRADIDKTVEVLDKTARSVKGRLEEPPHQIFLKELGASSVDYQIRVWCNTPDYWTVYQDIIRATKMHLDEAGLGIPFPQMDVHFDEPMPAASRGVAMPK